MSSRLWRLLALISAAVLLAGGGLFWWMSRRPAEPSRFLAVAFLPAGNQSGDPSLDWTEPLIPYSLARQFEGSPRMVSISAATPVEAAAAGATHSVHIVITRRQGSVAASYSVFTVATGKLAYQGVAGSPEGQPSQLLTALARKIAADLGPAAKANPAAFHSAAAARHLSLAISQLPADPAAATAGFQAAAEADPACGWCWLGWAETAARSGTDRALSVLNRSRQQASGIDPLSRARLDLLEAGMGGNRGQRLAALERIAQLLPADAAVRSQLADALVAERQFDRASEAYRRALAINPSFAALWNTLAYSLAYAGRFDEARQSLDQYARLDSSANPLDSQGEVAMMAGRFQESARLFTASYQKDKAFNESAALEKASLAHILNGDREAAGPLLERYLAERAQKGNPWAPIDRARWEYLTGQTAQSKARLKDIAVNPADPMAAIAASLRGLRQVLDGETADAAGSAALARSRVRNPAQAVFAAFAAAAVDPATSSSIADPALRAEALALGLTLKADWPAAANAWKASIQLARGGADAAQRELLALCLVSAGRASEAAGLITRTWPLLTREQLILYDFLIYPNLFFVRAEIARAAGNTSDAQRYYDLFLQSEGDRQDRFGHLARARQAARL